MKITVVTESNLFGGKTVTIDIPQKKDVVAWINERLSDTRQELVTADEITRVKKLLHEKASKADLNEIKESLETLEADVKNLKESCEADVNTITEKISGLPRTFEKDFKQIIMDNLSHPFALFAEQIQKIEASQKKMQEVLKKITSKEKEINKVYDAIKKVHAEIVKSQKEKKTKTK